MKPTTLKTAPTDAIVPAPIDRPLHFAAPMWVLPVIGLVGAVVGFCLLTLSIGPSSPA